MDDPLSESFAVEPDGDSTALPERVNRPLVVDVTVDDHVRMPLQIGLLQKAASVAAAHRGFLHGEIGIRVTDDATIRTINVKHLEHDYPTDVISFGYSANDTVIEGEMVISVDTARIQALEMGWSTDHELCLYVVHGALHLTGMDDQSPGPRAEMRVSEAEVMKRLGISGFEKFQVDRDFGSTEIDDGLNR